MSARQVCHEKYKILNTTSEDYTKEYKDAHGPQGEFKLLVKFGN
jgi:hypothetical protein